MGCCSRPVSCNPLNSVAQSVTAAAASAVSARAEADRAAASAAEAAAAAASIDSFNCAIDFEDSLSIEFSDCGDPCRTVSASAIIDPDVDNIIQITPDGLFADLTNPPTLNFDAAYRIQANTADGADTARLILSGGGATEDPTRGANIVIYGNDSPVGIPGGINLELGTVPGATIDLGFDGHVTSAVRFYFQTTLQWQVAFGGAFVFKNAANEITGAGAALLGANCPAVTVAAPDKWLKVVLNSGSVGYIPVWV